MANTAQSKKRARQSEARYAVNKARRSRIRTFLRKVEEALASGDAAVAAEALKAAQPELARGVFGLFGWWSKAKHLTLIAKYCGIIFCRHFQ